MNTPQIESYQHHNLSEAKDPFGPIVILGSHRSGTRLINQLLEAVHVHMGDVQESNHEAVCFLNVNDILLRSCGVHRANPSPFLQRLSDPSFVCDSAELARRSLDIHIDLYGVVPNGAQWGWKDPRTTITWPIWLQLFPSARMIHVVRNGIDVALSLQRRERRRLLSRWPNKIEVMFPPTLARGYKLWSLYVSSVALPSGGPPFTTCAMKIW